ncbi:MAG: hypothetical protein II661_09690 [Bacteroidales bacterium]|nr:hypothetical protein [Bacteroidales bacterium]
MIDSLSNMYQIPRKSETNPEVEEDGLVIVLGKRLEEGVILLLSHPHNLSSEGEENHFGFRIHSISRIDEIRHENE